MSIKTYIIDSFTDQPFRGNPAGVCILEDEMEETLMQSIARELGFSETAFVRALSEEGGYAIRYFSPVMEIPLCGHATLAASKVVFLLNGNLERIHFITHEKLDLYIDKSGEEMVMQFPVYETEAADAPASLVEALGLSQVSNCVFNKETNILMLEIEDVNELRSLKPDQQTLISAHSGIHGVLVTAVSDQEEVDFESRYFWPWSGTLEDPVTGGTHTFMALYWSRKLGKREMKSFQCSERTGSMTVTIRDENTLLIKGSAVVVFEGVCRV